MHSYEKATAANELPRLQQKRKKTAAVGRPTGLSLTLEQAETL